MSKDVKITMTHLFTRAIGMAMSKNRRDIGRIVFGNVTDNSLAYKFNSSNLLNRVVLQYWLILMAAEI